VLSLFGIALIRPEARLSVFDFVQPSHAGPLLNQQPPAPAPDPKAQSAAAEHHLPAFVPGHQTLTFSSDKAVESGAQSKAATASLDTQSKTPEWPEFIGAKKLFGAVKEPAPLAARAIGYYARGCLSGAVALPIDGPAWQEMRLSRNRNWGHPKLIALIERFAKDAQKLDGWPGLLVGDIAQPRGGPMITGHASHQVGLDADIWLTPMPDHRLTAKEREDIQATSMLDSTDLAVDPKVFTGKQVALIKRAASYPEVERIFVHPAIKKALCEAAGTDRKWLGKVRPFYGHYYHFHMRIKCPPGFAGCKPQTPPTGADGCGKEVDQWLARVVPAKTPAPRPPVVAVPKSPKPPKPPIMLSELPKECQALLGAKPDPVPIPRDALMSATAVRQVLAKAAAVKAALAKAAARPGATKTAASSPASSPALRPHMRKTVAAEKK
jgi:penicillin-insensitive murein endopeptidase